MTGSIEKVYSEALYELAKEDGTLGVISEELIAVSDIFSENAELYDILSAPTVTDKEKTELLDSIFGGKISVTALDFLCLAACKGRIRNLSGIAEALRTLRYTDEGIMEVTVTTVRALSDAQRTRLKEKLEAKYGRKIIMTEKTDPDMLGGVIVTCGDTMLDGSVRTKLDNMRTQLKNIIA